MLGRGSGSSPGPALPRSCFSLRFYPPHLCNGANCPNDPRLVGTQTHKGCPSLLEALMPTHPHASVITVILVILPTVFLCSFFQSSKLVPRKLVPALISSPIWTLSPLNKTQSTFSNLRFILSYLLFRLELGLLGTVFQQRKGTEYKHEASDQPPTPLISELGASQPKGGQ